MSLLELRAPQALSEAMADQEVLQAEGEEVGFAAIALKHAMTMPLSAAAWKCDQVLSYCRSAATRLTQAEYVPAA